MTERQVAYYEVWRDELNFRKLFNACLTHVNTDIIVDCAKENTLFSEPDSWPPKPEPGAGLTFEDSLIESRKWNSLNGNRLIIILGNYKPRAEEHISAPGDCIWEIHQHSEAYPPRYSHFDMSVDLGFWDQVETWPTYFMVWNGFKITKHALHRQPVTILPDGFSFMFLLKIRQAKDHRILLLDELEKRNLLKDSMYTCADPNNMLSTVMERVNATSYSGGVRPGNTLTCDDIYKEQLPGAETCFMEIVSETHIGSHFYTEKTVWPLAYSKPFLIHGAQYQNHDLKKLGFVLYDELFDYTFDTIESPRKRTQALADELLRIQNLQLDYVETYEKLRPKLEHNLRRLIQLNDYDEFMPDAVMKYGNKVLKEQLKECASYQRDRTINMNPSIGNWLPMLEKPKSNQATMRIVRTKPYLAKLFYGDT